MCHACFAPFGRSSECINSYSCSTNTSIVLKSLNTTNDSSIAINSKYLYFEEWILTELKKKHENCDEKLFIGNNVLLSKPNIYWTSHRCMAFLRTCNKYDETGACILYLNGMYPLDETVGSKHVSASK